MKGKRSAVVTGLAVFALTTLALHVLQPALSFRDEAVSYYVHGNHGWLLTIGLIALGTASLALTAALVHATWSAPPSVLMPVFMRPGPPILLGLSERILLGLYPVWLAA